MSNQLSNISDNTEALQNQGNDLQRNLTIIKNNLTDITNGCLLPDCKLDLDGLALDANFTNVPNISAQLSNIQEIVSSDFAGAADEVKIWFTHFKEIGI